MVRSRSRRATFLGFKVTSPVLGLYGGKDTGILIDTVEQMRDRLKDCSDNSEIIVYPEAPHAFHANYRQAEAEDGWKLLQAWFKKQGVA